MFLRINPASSTPIYEQIMIEIKKGILQGSLSLGETLPSVRSLAGDLGVNLHTVNKAYRLLTSEGVLEQLKKGFAITQQLPLATTDESLAKTKALMKELIIQKDLYKLSENELAAIQQAANQEIYMNDGGEKSCGI